MGRARLDDVTIAGFYTADYFTSADASPDVGYSEYAFTARHSLAWVPTFVGALHLRRRESVLDVGCADGSLLALLADRFGERLGIEADPAAAARCAASGVEVVGGDVADLRETDRFDLVCAMSTFEHLSDIRSGVQRVLQSLRPEGLLLFETPLVTDGPDDVWLRSSLEHVYYPTAGSLERLIRDELGADVRTVVGEIVGYGKTLVGVASRTALPATVEGALARLEKDGAAVAPGPLEFFWHVLHRADPTPALIELLPQLPQVELDEMLLRRVAQLWSTAVGASAGAEELSPARDWWRAQAERWESECARSNEALAVVGSARDWWRDEAERWRSVAAAGPDA